MPKEKKKKENKKQPFLYEKLQMADISNLSERKINITLHTRRKKKDCLNECMLMFFVFLQFSFNLKKIKGKKNNRLSDDLIHHLSACKQLAEARVTVRLVVLLFEGDIVELL